jgi:uncharacterized protein YkwD
MLSIFLFIFSFFLFNNPEFTDKNSSKDRTGKVCLSGEEKSLVQQINNYRISKNLPPVPVSASLSYVAQTHARDLANNYKLGNRNCNMHSWSSKGPWRSCCYTNNHKQANCMWLKPQELTTYKGYGYEISFGKSNSNGTAVVSAAEALSGWKGSPSHHQVMMNQGTWKKVKWNAMGVGIYKGYAIVWFGEADDPAGGTSDCN